MPELAGLETGLCLEVASEIGQALVQAAVWHERRCSWIGAWPEETARGVEVTYKALGPDLYAGTAGVGIFLAELGCAIDEVQVRGCAVAALRHAASRADSAAQLTPLGLYGGRLGVALALAYGARLLGEPELDAAARAIVRAEGRAGRGEAREGEAREGAVKGGTTEGNAAQGGSRRARDYEEFDLISGRAGAIVGLLALTAILEEPDLLERAVEHGEALLAMASRDAGGLSWRAPGATADERPLTGLSHGAAGVASALLELAAASGEARFHSAALEAFAYERALFDERMGNWPDLRESIRAVTGDTPTYATFWCHGAPGIALSRIRALELGAQMPGAARTAQLQAEDRLRTEAGAALETTAAWVRAALGAGAVSYSLCHGLAGNAEIVAEGRRVEDPPGLSTCQLAADVGSHGIERYRSSESGWPSGVQGGEAPSLFLGDAGVGRFYLRLARPEFPSLLAIRPEDFAAGATSRRVGGA
jgi:lantibiotic modifying enzyme